MSSPLNLQDETAVPLSTRRKAAVYLSVTLATVITALLVVGRILLARQGESSIMGVLSPIIIISVWAGAGLIWRGRMVAGSLVSAVVLFGGTAFFISQRANLGVLLVIDDIFLIGALFAYAFPRRRLSSSMFVVTMVGIVLLIADLYWPAPRISVPQTIQVVLYVSTAVVVMAVFALILRQFSRFLIRGKLTITFLAVTLTSFIVLAVGNFIGVRTALVDDANQILSTAASQTAVTIDDFLSNTQSNIRSEAGIMGKAYDWAYYRRLPVEDRSSLGVLGEAKAIELLKTYRDKDPLNIASYALLDMDGRVMFEYPPSDRNPDESNRSYFTAVLETGLPYISPVEFSPDDGEAYLTFSALVYDDTGERFGVLRGHYKASILQTLVARSTGLVGGQSFAVLFDENHLHLAHGGAPETLYKLTVLPSPEEIAAMQIALRLPNRALAELSTDLPDLDANLSNIQNEPIFTATDVATENRINQVAVAMVNKQPWVVAFFQPQDVFLAPVQTQTQHTVLLAVAIMAVVAVIAVIVAGFIAQPITRLDAVASQIAAGNLAVQAEVDSNDEIGTLAKTFNLMTAQLRDLVSTLENRVAERTRALEISSDVSRRLSTILDQRELVRAVVEQVQQAFNYYHAHIYLFDEQGKNLVMVGGTGEAGRAMLARKHQIAAGQGLVGRAGQTHNIVLAPDVSQEKGWLPNPLLPDTKAEIAVPIVSGEHIFGVLDVQHNVVNGLTEADASLLQSVANQAAIGLQNARLYAQTQQVAAREAQINAIGQKIQGTTTVEEALQTAVRELGRALQAGQTSVRLRAGDDGGNGNGRSA